MSLALTKARTEAWRKRPLPEGLAGEVRRLREKKKWTQKKLAESAGVSFSQIQAIESGRCKNPTVRTLEYLAHALDADFTALARSIRNPTTITET